MTDEEIAHEIEHFEGEMLYHLGNYRRAIEVGAVNSRDDNFSKAAAAAAILTALKGLLP